MSAKILGLPITDRHQPGAAFRRYREIVDELDSVPRISFEQARRLIDAYSDWVRLFCAEDAEDAIAYMRRLVAQREFSRN